MKNKRNIIMALLAVVLLAVFGYLASHKEIFADVSSESFKVYNMPLFSGTVGSETSEVSVTIPKGEKESVQISVENLTSQPINNFTIEKNDLVNQSNQTILKSNIDERVIHNWKQKKIIPAEIAKDNRFKIVDVDELLVRNDKTNFFSPSILSKESTLLNKFGSAGSINSTEQIQMTIQPREKRKVLFSINVPRDKSGSFSGKFILKDGGRVLKTINLKVNVLETELVSTASADGKIIGCFMNDMIKIREQYSDALISESNFRKRMQTLKETGCQSLILRVGNNSNNTKALEIISEQGFAGPIVLNYYWMTASGKMINIYTAPQANQDATKLNNLLVLNDENSRADFKKMVQSIKADKNISVPIMFYGIDEPNISSAGSGNAEKYALHKRRADNIISIVNEVYGTELSSSNVLPKVVSAANLYATQQLFKAGGNYFPGMTIEGLGERSDIGSISKRIAEVKSGQPMMGQETIYYQGWLENPIRNRYLSGFGLIQTGLAGSYMNTIYGYSSAAANPIYVEDNTHPTSAWNKQMMTFYPASDGYIPTIQSEGMREGILDTKYYLTYQNLKKRESKCSTAQKSDLSSISSRIQTSMSGYNWTKTPTLNGEMSIDPDRFNQTRQLLKNYIQVFESCTSDLAVIPQGFKVYSPTGSVPSTTFDTSKVTVFQFDPTRKGWKRSDKEGFSLTKNQGFYLRNIEKNTKEVSINQTKATSGGIELKKGWNLLSSDNSKPLSQFVAVMTDPKNSCTKEVNLQSLIDMKFAYSGVYIIADDRTSDATKAFKFYGYGQNKLKMIEQGKGFWYYMFDEANPNDPRLSVYPCR